MALPLKISNSLILFLLLLAVPLFAWERVYSSALPEKVHTISHAWDGGYVLAGYTMPIPELRDFLFMKIDTGGNLVWSRSYGDPLINESSGKHIQTADSCYLGIASSFFPHSHPWIFKLDQTGDTLWSKNYVLSGSSSISSINMNSDSGFIFTSYAVIAEAGVGANYQKFLFMRIDSDGDTMWVRKYGPDSLSYGHHVKQTVTGDFLACGSTHFNGHLPHDVCIIKVSQTGDSLWAKTYDFFGGIDAAYDFVFTTGDSTIMIGSVTLAGEEKTDLLIMHIDEAGSLLWWKSYGGPETDYGSDILSCADGGFIVLANSFSDISLSYYIWLLKFDEHGDTVWTRKFGEISDHSEYGANILATDDGGYIIAGHSVNLDSDIADPLVIRVDSLGNHVPSGISENSPSAKPEAFEISAYPNPFNSAVKFSAPAGAEIEIFDVNGRRISVIPDPDRESRGIANNLDSRFHGNDKTLVWHPDASLCSGVYLVRVWARDESVTKRIVYLK